MVFTLRTGDAPPGINGDAFYEGWRQEGVATARDVDPAIQRLTDALAAAGFPSKDIFSVRLAVEEAIVNGLKHAHQGDPSKEVRVGYLVTPEQVLLVIEDEGPGFCPEELPDPLDPENLERACGRGVFLMRHYMTWVRYNDRGNCVTMCKRRA
jgi:serine/threonine-protein kinase RsbW